MSREGPHTHTNIHTHTHTHTHTQTCDKVPAAVVEGAAVDGFEDDAGDGRVDEEDDPEPEGD